MKHISFTKPYKKIVQNHISQSPKHKSESLSPQKISLSIPLFFSFQLLMSRMISTQLLHVFKHFLLGEKLQLSHLRFPKKKWEKWRVGLVRGNPPKPTEDEGMMLNLDVQLLLIDFIKKIGGKGFDKTTFHRNCC